MPLAAENLPKSMDLESGVYLKIFNTRNLQNVGYKFHK